MKTFKGAWKVFKDLFHRTPAPPSKMAKTILDNMDKGPCWIAERWKFGYVLGCGGLRVSTGFDSDGSVHEVLLMADGKVYKDITGELPYRDLVAISEIAHGICRRIEEGQAALDKPSQQETMAILEGKLEPILKKARWEQGAVKIFLEKSRNPLDNKDTRAYI